MTKEQIINKIKAEFKGKASDGVTCKYLTKDGKKCAIGLFIPDGHDAQDNGDTIDSLLIEYPDLKAYMPSTNIDFLLAFQDVHDEKLHDAMDLEQQKLRLIDFVNK